MIPVSPGGGHCGQMALGISTLLAAARQPDCYLATRLVCEPHQVVLEPQFKKQCHQFTLRSNDDDSGDDDDDD